MVEPARGEMRGREKSEKEEWAVLEAVGRWSRMVQGWFHGKISSLLAFPSEQFMVSWWFGMTGHALASLPVLHAVFDMVRWV